MSDPVSHPESGLYARPLYIPFRDCDCLQRVSLQTWLSLLAELAGEQYERRNLGREQLIGQGQVFLVSRFALRIHRHPAEYETLTASTFEKGVDTVYFRRNYAFRGEDGALCAEASSLWLLCDPVRHRILRPAALGHPVLDVDEPCSCPFPEKLTVPENAALLGTRTVVYSDLDANHHVYCANYGRFFMDCLPQVFQKLPYKFFEINYVKEAQLGETLTMLGATGDGSYTICGMHEDGSACFLARMTF